MKHTKITHEILQNLNPSTIIYAEFAEEGAMGCAGTARIFTVEDGKLKFYLIDDIFNNQQNSKIYAETATFLTNLIKTDTLIQQYAGYGNYAHKPRTILFQRDDDHATFIYKHNNKTYKIPTSCKGVYDHIVSKFAIREIPIDDLEQYFDKIKFKLSSAEFYFFEQYLQQIKRNDSGQGWFDFTALDYYDAVRYLRHISGEDYLLDNHDISECTSAISKYRLSYVIDKLGWNKLDKIIVSMIKANQIDLFHRIENPLGENVNNIYNTLETINSDRTSLSSTDPNNLEHLFNRPILVNFDKSAHTTIIKDIFERPGNSFNPDALSIAYYLANYLLNEDKLPFSDVLAAVFHIIEVLPTDDFNHTHTDELFWLCGEIADRAWRYLEEDESVQTKYRTILYEIYWPRVGSLWPILHRDEFEFKRPSAAKMFSDAFSFVMSLEDITDHNLSIKEFLDANAKHIGYKAGSLGRRAFVYSLQGLSPEQEFEHILTTIEPSDYHSFLTYPKGIEEAKLLLNELFRTDPDSRITGLPRLATFEALLITPNTIGVGEFILNYIDQHFNDFIQIISTEAINVGAEPLDVLTDFFIAISKGITEENEFPAMNSIKSKLLDLGCDADKLNNSAKHARKHRRTILFQRSALQKFF